MYRTGIEPPERIWWKKADRHEKVWVWMAFGWCMVLFAMMPLWHLRGGQNPAGIRHRVEPVEYEARVREFIDAYQVGTESGIPVVEPRPEATSTSRRPASAGSPCSGSGAGPSTCSTSRRST